MQTSKVGLYYFWPFKLKKLLYFMTCCKVQNYAFFRTHFMCDFNSEQRLIVYKLRRHGNSVFSAR